MDHDRHLAHVLSDLSEVAKSALEFFKSNLSAATKHDLQQSTHQIMSVLSEYVAKVDQNYEAIGQSVEELSNAFAGVASDVSALKSIIEKINNNPGPISSEDQALLDNSLTKLTALTDKIRNVTTSIKELDAQTDAAPPVPPVSS